MSCVYGGDAATTQVSSCLYWSTSEEQARLENGRLELECPVRMEEMRPPRRSAAVYTGVLVRSRLGWRMAGWSWSVFFSVWRRCGHHAGQQMSILEY